MALRQFRFRVFVSSWFNLLIRRVRVTVIAFLRSFRQSSDGLIEKASENIIENNFDKFHPTHHKSTCTPNRNQFQTRSEISRGSRLAGRARQ